MYSRKGYYYPYFYPNYNPSGRGFLAAAGDGVDMKEEAVKAIASLIVDNRQELIRVLDENKIACSCSLHDATEADLSDIIVENIDNKGLQKWIINRTKSKFNSHSNAGGIDPVTAVANAIGSIFNTIGKGVDVVKGGQEKRKLKQEYKNMLTKKAIEYKEAQEKAKRAERTTNTLFIVGGSVALVGIGALIYYSSIKQNPKLQYTA